MARWLEWTQTFDLDVRHIPGNQNKVADALSRINLATVTVAKADPSLLRRLKSAYQQDGTAKSSQKIPT